MNNHKATIRQVADDSFLILVDGHPVHQTADASAALLFAQRLQRLFRDPQQLDSVVVLVTAAGYDIRARKASTETVLLELSEQQEPFAWLQASVVAENLRSVMQGWRTTRQPPLPNEVPLTPVPHKPITQPTTTVLNPKNPSPEEHLPQLESVLRRVPTDYGTVYLFTKRYDRENIHAGLVTSERAFDLSPISNWLTWEQTTVEIVKLLKEPIPFLRIQGIVGANTAKNLYFRMDHEVPLPMLEVDGMVYEIDLDNNGDKEVILTTGIPPLTIVFSWAEERFQEVNVNLTLKRNSTQLNPNTNLIDVYTPAEEKVSYRYERDRLVKVTPSPAAPTTPTT